MARVLIVALSLAVSFSLVVHFLLNASSKQRFAWLRAFNRRLMIGLLVAVLVAAVMLTLSTLDSLTN
ncbi:hypothetical protein [Cupriavidus campinensis]|uniref:DUF2909 domain-containing protein n=1 Tax=Cupriavidus campinensis TaxID=151783 RepID=A0ABY3ESS6_9BURK|nr:hypothetical protein [Cupriavidus campinensis]TSP14024.1 hypothetical protein FGG12_06015 [Cupriavidus campinensis]